jgi:hypothetical protein
MSVPGFSAESSLIIDKDTAYFASFASRGESGVEPANCWLKVHEVVEKITGSHDLAMAAARFICGTLGLG